MAEATSVTPDRVCRKANWKRLIVLCDGTAQDSLSGDQSAFPTNVTRLSRALSPNALITEDNEEREVEQVVFYQPGVGTQSGQKLRGGAYGLGVSANIRAAYGFLAHNYDPGDEIFFFGFSRGAFTARSIAGLVTNLGLLTKRGMDYFPKVYAEYYDKQWFSDHKAAGNPQFEFSQGLRDELNKISALVDVGDAVRVIGVWDTVGFHAEGWVSRLLSRMNWLLGESEEKIELHNAELSSKVRYAYHALALDERRSEFKPTLWQWPTSYVLKKGQGLQEMRQVWFSGAHSDIGGGLFDPRLSDITLAWMIAQCSKHHQLAFTDVEPCNPPNQYGYLILPDTPDKVHKASDVSHKWGTAQGPGTRNPDAGPLLERIKNAVLRLFYKFGAADRQPLQMEGTQETIHRSIRDRNLSKWPCGPLGKPTEESKWPLARQGEIRHTLIETDAALEADETADKDAEKKAVDIEGRFQGRIRPMIGQNSSGTK